MQGVFAHGQTLAAFLAGSLAGVQVLALVILVGCLLAHLVWDYRELILPDVLNLLILATGLAVAAFAPLPDCSWSQSWQGFLIALASAWGFYELVWWVRGEEGFGFGDVKLFAAAGSWLGPAKLIGMVLIGSLASLFIIGLLGLCLRRWHVRVELPFGPGLILGFVVMFAFPELINNSLQWLLF